MMFCLTQRKIFLPLSFGLIGLLFFGMMLCKKRFNPVNTPPQTLLNASTPKKRHAIVFVHGTSAAHLSPLDLWHPHVVKDFFKRIFTKKSERVDLQRHSLTRAVNQSFRKNKFIKGSAGAMHNEGLFEIPHDMLERYKKSDLSQEERRLSAIHIAYAFDYVYSHVHKDKEINEVRDYYAFGWKGLLDKYCRIDSAYDLYEELLTIKADKITLVTHSYGGAVALYLSKVEKQEKKGIVIDDLIMYAPPVERETAKRALHDMFKNVFLFYSEGDMTQVADKFTTDEGECHRTLSSYVGDEIERFDDKMVKDVCFVVNGSRSYFDHMGPWSSSGSPMVVKMLLPFPTVVLSPLFLDLLKTTHTNVDCDMHIIDCDERLMIDVRHQGSKKSLVETGDIGDLLADAQKLMEKNWDPSYNFFAQTKIGSVVPLFAKKSGV